MNVGGERLGQSMVLASHGYVLETISVVDLRSYGLNYTVNKLILNDLNYWFKIERLKLIIAWPRS